MFGSTERRKPRLADQPRNYFGNIPITYVTTSQTDGRTTCRSSTALCVASRGEKLIQSTVVGMLATHS